MLAETQPLFEMTAQINLRSGVALMIAAETQRAPHCSGDPSAALRMTLLFRMNHHRSVVRIHY